ncbi:MAG: hypothetical protein Q8M99_11825 [Methylotenera sp.]|nr:hypothetical protein [Methylotenera sp.]
MSSVDLEDKAGDTYSPDVFTRDELGKTVVIQAVTNVDPTTGTPNASTEATLLALKAVADSLLSAAQAIEVASESLNIKTTAVNTGAISGTVALDGATLSALETISVNGVATETTLSALNAKTTTLAVDAISGSNYQKVKVGFGVDGAFVSASASNPLPTTTDNGLTNTQLRASSVQITGTVLIGGSGTKIQSDGAEVDSFNPLPVFMNGGIGLTANGNVVSTGNPLPVTADSSKAEDALHASGATGVFVLGVRNDSDVATAGDGDYTALKMDENGRLKVSTKPASFADITGDITAIQATIDTAVAGGTVAGDVSSSSNVMAFCIGTFAGINCTFEGSLEATGDTNWFAIQAIRSNANTVELTTGVLGAKPAYAWELSVNALRRIRVRATARTSGTQSWRFVQGTYATEPIPASQVSATQPVSGTVTATVAGATLALPTIVADVASAAITTTTTTATLTPTAGMSYSVDIPVTVVSGTNPTMDVVVQESDDSGTNWFDVFHFPRITATGIYRSPPLRLRGNRVRYVQTITGTTPSFTRAINRLQRQDDCDNYSQLFDRAISLTTLNAVTPALNIQGANHVELIINLGTATTPPTLQLEGSDDNANWYALGAPLLGVASSTVRMSVIDVSPSFIRARVSVVGATVVAGYVLIKGH